ncbi:glycosyltransferase [Phenylobacterium sp. LH3H17]|uniref:glycosyltransferase n=1 Tax=Phenylobacterium sp. LH3H17 TaxID=2903901 RepID=UPI0020C94BE3|nr:glycosyltransferase [Phenylobacterium sp. LH3H17]UTP38068.1 glycosyltransferase [Phenylobacterium sp. LH3H17]
MLSVIVPTLNSERDLANLLARLVPAAVDGLVSQVIVLDGGSTDGTLEVSEDAGADVASTFASALAIARRDWVLILPADLRLRSGWDGAVGGHLTRRGGNALVLGERDGEGLLGRLRPAPSGVLVEKSALKGAGPGLDLVGLRRKHGGRARL